jgi:hypothetical protein
LRAASIAAVVGTIAANLGFAAAAAIHTGPVIASKRISLPQCVKFSGLQKVGRGKLRGQLLNSLRKRFCWCLGRVLVGRPVESLSKPFGKGMLRRCITRLVDD